MIFGNPGVYDEEGNFSNFAIQVDKLVGEFSSLNLILDMKLYPSYLAYNMNSCLLGGVDWNNDIFNREDEFLYNLPDRELMIELIKQSFLSLFGIEKAIEKGIIDYELIKNDESILFDYIDDIVSNERLLETRNNLWDIDDFEYFGKGVYPFIVNFNGFTKIVLVNKTMNIDELGELSRFFNKDMTLKKNLQFFDEGYWHVDVSILKTSEFKKIILGVNKFLSE
ncbi:hypothetical protein [Actinobacillus suis]|uniref:Uncharacterized protein n=4 Tax=Actinobacillus suis TaxID=716 RepID=K0G6U5_ACTSU|nr:hypothetical protein [Actinobacillus suis]AFU19464.1 hypothetical protein ASU2_06630 [Actinobacillus suis H91-0380]AIJ31603.1 hypothetical protein ASU1_06700 [Actinobacillus suis ATCC 33415]MCO4168692.1 hypothetical protein [Actinobacillus suis]MCQ9630850.1 hypothetical protein [Actinobacillus suis]MCQ9633183.1 hypothetical protein [Actinobacillus suis]